MNEDHLESGEVSQVVMSHISSVKESMISNIDKVLERGRQLDTLIDKSDQLSVKANHFHTASKSLRRQLWWSNQKLKVIGLISITLFAIVS